MRPLDDDPESLLEVHLDRDEKLVWSGKPAGGIRFTPHDLFAIPFGLFFLAFSCFWMTMVLFGVSGTAGEQPETPPLPILIIFPLFGLPFVLTGLYITFGRFWFDARRRKRTSYGLTNHRILLLSGSRSKQLKSIELSQTNDITLSEHANGTGTITFDQQHPFAKMFTAFGPSWPGTSQFFPPQLESIQNPRKVYQLIREHRNNNK